MKKIIFGILALIVFQGCFPSDASNKTIESQNENLERAIQAVPVPEVSHFMERSTVAR